MPCIRPSVPTTPPACTSRLFAHFPYETAQTESFGNDFRSLLLMLNVAVNFPGLWWWGYFLPGMGKIPGGNCWHCLPQLQGDKWPHVEGVSKP